MTVRTEVTGTVVHVNHGPFCRVGRVLRGVAVMDRPGFEPAEVDDRRQVRSPR